MAISSELAAACAHAGLSPAGAIPLRQHATGVYWLPCEALVARVGRPESLPAARRSQIVTRWYAEHGVPVTEPADIPPVVLESAVVTFWHYYPQSTAQTPPVAALGHILRLLHAAPAPPVTLPAYRPLHQLSTILGSHGGGLPESDRRWLRDRVADVITAYHQLNSHLGVGPVHGDAYPGNLLWGSDGVALLGDWDETAIAPRELDLANTYQGRRFGRTDAQLAEFTAAYGWDVREWSGFATLREMRDLHTLGAFVQRAERGDQAAARELAHRIASLREGDTESLWQAA